MKPNYPGLYKACLFPLMGPSSMICDRSESTSVFSGSSVINSCAISNCDCRVTKLRAIGKATEQREPFKRITANVITCGRCMDIS